MRLSCPNCGAVYEVDAGMIPADGNHVQCSACDTRWFVRRPAPELERPSEDQIIARLESRTQRPRLAAVGDATPRIVSPAQPADAGRLRQPVAPHHSAAVTPLRPRPNAERSPLPPPPTLAPLAPAAPEDRRSRFGVGFATALAVAAAAIVLYLRADEISGRIPALGPALDPFAALVDAQRDRIEARFGPARDRVMNAVFPEG